jgi:hypothetical protein
MVAKESLSLNRDGSERLRCLIPTAELESIFDFLLPAVQDWRENQPQQCGRIVA